MRYVKHNEAGRDCLLLRRKSSRTSRRNFFDLIFVVQRAGVEREHPTQSASPATPPSASTQR
jgi:hypothetical protein